MFHSFVVERSNLQRADWFERELVRKVRRRAAKTRANGARHKRGLLWKLGRNFPTWKQRYMELARDSMDLFYFMPSRKLLETEAK